MAPDDRRNPEKRDPKPERARSPVAPPQGPEASPPPREVGRDPARENARGDLLGEPSDYPITGPDVEDDRE